MAKVKKWKRLSLFSFFIAVLFDIAFCPLLSQPLYKIPSRLSNLQTTIPSADSVGYSYYDWQTQQSMPERVVYDPIRKLVQMVWMADSSEDVSNSVRGSYLGVVDFNGEAPQVISHWGRIETAKANWPSVVSFSDGSIGVAAHAANTFSKNLAPPAYSAFITHPISNNSFSYARSSVGANDVVHIIFTFRSGVDEGQLGYIYSTNSGESWSEPVVLTGTNATGGITSRLAGPDCYAIHAFGNDIVVAYVDRNYVLWSRRSTDNGASWQLPVRIYGPASRNYHETADLGNGIVHFVSDTVKTSGLQIDVIHDMHGQVHYVFALVASYIQGNGVKDGQGSIQPTTDTMHVSNLYRTTLGLGYYKEGNPSVNEMGPPAGEEWNGIGLFLNGGDGDGKTLLGANGSGYSCYPQLGVDANDALYCVYTSVKNNDIKQTIIGEGADQKTISALYGHVYATHKLPNTNWSDPIDITPLSVDCLYGTLANIVDEKLYIAYQADLTPGVSSLHKTSRERTTIYALALPVSQLNKPGSVSVPTDNNNSGVSISTFPNPFYHSVNIAFETPVPDKIRIELYNALGIKVGTLYNEPTQPGMHYISMDKHDFSLSPGAYYIVLTAGKYILTHGLTLTR